ncbi:MAG: DinB family protein [Paenibacillus sp.]|nr:DinB family protein [Paenibacillus sp.]
MIAMNDLEKQQAGTEKQNLLEQFQTWLDFVRSLELDEVKWNLSLGDGRWTVREVVSHIALWDQYFLVGAIEKIHDGVPLTVKHLNYDEFNENAKSYGKQTSVADLSDLAFTCRQRLLDTIETFPEPVFYNEYADADGHPFTVVQYLKDFIWHDQHHLAQMKPLL